MFIITVVILCVLVLKTCVQESCKIIPINSAIMEGECCIFTTHEDSRYKNREILEEIIKESLPKINHLKSTQPLSEPCREDTRRPRRRPKTSNISPMTTDDHIEPEIQNTFVLPPDENIIIPIRGDKIYGECNILIKDQCYRREYDKIIPTLVEGELLPKDIAEERGVLSNEKVQGIQPNGVVSPNISPITILKPPQKILGNQNDPRPYLDLEMSDFVKEFDVTSTLDFENLTPVGSDKPEVSHKNKIKNYTNLEVGKDNATSSGKTIVDLDNRNAVDVPPIKCPEGQNRDLSGKCVFPF